LILDQFNILTSNRDGQFTSFLDGLGNSGVFFAANSRGDSFKQSRIFSFNGFFVETNVVPADVNIEFFFFVFEGFLGSALKIVGLLVSKVEGLSEDIFHHGSVVVISKSKAGVFSVEVNEDNDIIIGM